MVEFKTAENAMPSNIFETVCGMLNRNGGHIFFGITDDGAVSGITPDAAMQIRKDFINCCNNPNKIFPTIHAEVKTYSIDDKIILYAFIPESSSVHNTANKIFDRNEDGDFDITKNTHLVSQAYIRKSDTYVENKIFPYAKLRDLREDLIARVRKTVAIRTPNHPWKDMSDMELLKSAGLYGFDLQSGTEGINLAGILLLGKDETIMNTVPYYRTDALLRVHDTERYDDRDDVRTNLIESCDRLTQFIVKHTNDKFYLNEEGIRLDIRSIIARELCANMLIHREYSNPSVARLIITKDTIHTTNANKPRQIGFIDVANYIPFPKNPKIAKFFKEIGYADELGSGFKKIDKYTKIYSGAKPIIKEGDDFEVTIPLDKTVTSGRPRVSQLRVALLEYIGQNDGLSREQINKFAYPLLEGFTEKQQNSKIHNLIADLSRKKIILNKGTRMAGLWVLNNVHNQIHNQYTTDARLMDGKQSSRRSKSTQTVHKEKGV